MRIIGYLKQSKVAVALIVAVPFFLMLYSAASKARLPDPLTMTLTVSSVLPYDAVMVASPAALAVTLPSESTTATVGLSVLQETPAVSAASPVSP